MTSTESSLPDVRARGVAAVMDADRVGLRRLAGVDLDVGLPGDHVVADPADAPGIARKAGRTRGHALRDDAGPGQGQSLSRATGDGDHGVVVVVHLAVGEGGHVLLVPGVHRDRDLISLVVGNDLTATLQLALVVGPRASGRIRGKGEVLDGRHHVVGVVGHLAGVGELVVPRQVGADDLQFILGVVDQARVALWPR